jgi:hypothetical protein
LSRIRVNEDAASLFSTNLNAAKTLCLLPAAVDISRWRHVDFAQMNAIHAMIFKQGLHQKMAAQPG